MFDLLNENEESYLNISFLLLSSNKYIWCFAQKSKKSIKNQRKVKKSKESKKLKPEKQKQIKTKHTIYIFMIIIGGGSTGLYLAIKRAEENNKEKRKEKITVVEEHQKLGLPVQCTGILTDDIYNLLDKKEVEKITLNKINKTKIFSKHNSVQIELKDNLIIDNVKFIELLEDKAKKLNVKILTNHKYISNKENIIKIKNIEKNKIITLKDNFLVGADGPLSKVASSNNLCLKRKYLIGVQARVKTIKHKKNTIDFYPSIGTYAWCVPEGKNIYRIGLAVTLEKQTGKNELFQDFLKKYPGEQLEIQAGLIPLFAPRQKIISTKNDFSVALIGDAALQIKNTTGGGILPGMKAAYALSKGTKHYKRHIKKLNRELYMHYLLHKILSKYKDEDLFRLIKKMNNKNIKKQLREHNRDNSVKLILSFLKNPKMLSEGLRALHRIF
ncbi:MAG: hypothetical protein ACP5N2_07530 [Candidatus Nanoarchaeia archaeon]